MRPDSDGVSLGAVAAIAVPCLGSVLADPLMSLVDTGVHWEATSNQLGLICFGSVQFSQAYPPTGAVIVVLEQHTLKEMQYMMLHYSTQVVPDNAVFH